MICLSGVEKAFAGRPVLRGVDLDVLPGETMVILGGSGSGKSVTLRHIVGLLKPDRGVVRVDGEPVQDLDEDELIPVRRKVGFLFQGGALFDSMDVFDNIAFPLREAGWDEERIAARVPEVLRLVDLEPDVARQMPDALSGGMRKRVALARAIAVNPQAILYDEPTTGLDPVTSTTINELIRSMQRRLGVTSVVVTHDIDSAFKVGDRIAFLCGGRIAFLGTVAEARTTTDARLRAFLEGRPHEEFGTC
ncbi:MAG: ABC transporter ATP-binding protein [Acidobacteria bacterium]|nr:MAG: ABC transporter ATP-binding protein [Acidobacteriota bacterium]